jgi:hypothetical protein
MPPICLKKEAQTTAETYNDGQAYVQNNYSRRMYEYKVQSRIFGQNGHK